MSNDPANSGIGGLDLLKLPLIGPFLKWRHSRRLLQSVTLLVALLMIVHGFLGPQLAPRNLSTLLSWVHFRGLLILVLLVAGNFFCMACPFMLPRDLARRFSRPVRNWPRWLRNKWLSIALFVAILFSYEYFDLWGSPLWTAWLIITYFSAALIVDVFFKNASFCKYVCPIGQFNFVSSTMSPFEVKVADPDRCVTCETKDCIKGTRHSDNPWQIVQRGCELALFQPRKTGNMDCTFCMDCVHACPHDNVAVATTLPGSELWKETRRSGIGHFTTRTDISVLALIFTFGALLNAFGMVSPVYAFQDWIAGLMNTTSELPVLGMLFFLLLVVEPAILLGVTAFVVSRWTATGEKLLPIIVRYSYALIPLGFSIWVAHYSFHFLTGLWTVIPVIQDMLLDVGITFLGDPFWQLSGIRPGLVYPLEIGFLSLGLLGSLLVSYQISVRDYTSYPKKAFIPWAMLSVILYFAAIWLLNQPMEMRGTFLGG